MTNRRLIAVALAVALGGPVLTGRPASAQQDWSGLPPGEGRQITFATCSACHSARLVSQQRLSRQRWDEIITRMVEEQGMPKPDPEVRSRILDYLAATLSPKGQPSSRPQPGVSPFPDTPPMNPPGQ